MNYDSAVQSTLYDIWANSKIIYRIAHVNVILAASTKTDNPIRFGIMYYTMWGMVESHRLRWRGAIQHCWDRGRGRRGFLQGEREIVVVWVFFFSVCKIRHR